MRDVALLRDELYRKKYSEGITDFNLIGKQDISGILIFDYKLLSKRKTAGN